MRVFLDGATGYLGRAVLNALVGAGHEVTAAVRERPKRVAAAGITTVVGDVTDANWLREQLTTVDGAINTASPNDETSGEFDSEVLDGVVAAFAGTDRRYVHTGGSWIHGSGAHISEQTPPAPPPMVSWRPRVVDRVRAAAAEARMSEAKQREGWSEFRRRDLWMARMKPSCCRSSTSSSRSPFSMKAWTSVRRHHAAFEDSGRRPNAEPGDGPPSRRRAASPAPVKAALTTGFPPARTAV